MDINLEHRISQIEKNQERMCSLLEQVVTILETLRRWG